MSLLMPVAVVLLVSAQLPLSTPLRLPTGETAELAADSVSYAQEQRVLTARGHAVLSSGSVVLRADELSYDQAHGTAVARGNVMLVNGLMAAVADELSVDLESSEAVVQGGLFMEKRGVTPQQLLQAQTPQELRDLGETPVLMSGRRIKRSGDNTYQVEGIALAPCLCGESVPSWRVEASSARVEMGKYASLTLPVVFVSSVPVLAVPWLYLPLSERQSGLLFPRPTSTAASGFALELPVFITLGRSYDLTLTPGFYLGGGEVERTRSIGNETLTREEPQNYGIRGPRLLTEFRYVPAVGTEGRVTLGLLHDLQPVRNPVTADFFLTDTGDLIRAPRGLRGEASLQHRQDLGGGWYDRIDAFAVSDGFYTRDLTADIVARAAQYLSSSGVIYRRGEDQWVGLEVGLRQDIRWGYDLFGRSTVPPAGAPASTAITAAPRTFQKLPTLSWVLAERPLGGSRLVGGMRVEFTRLSPLLSLFGDEGLDGHFESDGLWAVPGGTVREPDGAQGNGVFDGADREARDRVDLLPRLSSSFALGSFARLSPALSVRQDFYLGEVTGRAAQRGYPLLDLVLDSRLARTFELGGVSLLHSIEPSITLRYVPTVWGDLPSPGALPDSPGQPYDEIDSALPSTPAGVARRFLHAVVELNQTLHTRRGSSREEILRLSLGQGFDLSRFAPTLGSGLLGSDELLARDTFGRLSARLGRFSGTGVLRYDPNSRQITQLSADFRVDVPQANLYARYDDLLGEGSDRLRRSLDALVGPAPKNAQRAQFLTAGTQATFGFGLGLRYEALLQPQTRSEAPLLQQTFGVSYGPACNCWRVEGLARLARGQACPEFGLNLTVTGVGTFGTGG
ncbi:Outer membrane protein Imp, required for envelope biogenesis [Cystobacter fuscus DSM 2262]|uniref:Outer membrane protein Imp, required for envelope biogenesis n=1 Tax=Cystobacter fuscus (strain ATCC 25194 / DSM 2262 / NBRC 100088 / M29) TaxID=1242864 RepID=S9QQ48_CYSF2|nr:LPS assembly protein LptD [Cystobacter fuscus]EPX63424.1 Outer membrane protein Imp, required for envelope biogenesis [Cystobacter fuscus DSM 2262]